LLYIPAEITVALLIGLFVKYAIGNEAFLGANSPNYAYPLPLIFGVSIGFCSADGCDIGCCIYKGLERFWWNSNWCYGWAGHILFSVCFRDIDEPRQVLGPCLVARRNAEKLWLYWTATFIGTSKPQRYLRKKLAAINPTRMANLFDVVFCF
jgi:aquaporin Z